MGLKINKKQNKMYKNSRTKGRNSEKLVAMHLKLLVGKYKYVGVIPEEEDIFK